MNTTLKSEHQDKATGEAARVVIANLQKQLGTPGLSAGAHTKLLIPVYGLNWNRNVIRFVATNELNNLFVRLRNSALPKVEYDRLTTFFNRAFAASNLFPPELREWQLLAERFRLSAPNGWSDILAAATFLLSRGIPTPASLAVVPPQGLEVLCAEVVHAEIVRTLWGIARCTFAPSSSSTSFLIPQHQEFTEHHLVNAIKRHKTQVARSNQIRAKLPPKLKKKRSFLQLGPMQKIKHMAKADLPPEAISRFCLDAAQANLLKQIKGSLPSVCSAFRCYIAFCELRDLTPFPPTEETVIQRSSVFKNTATYGNYVSYLQKCCFFLKYPTSWFSDVIKHIAKGLKKCQDRSFRFHNFIRSSLLARVIQHESVKSEFAHAAFLSFLFALRVPSETLQLRRAFRGDQLLEFSPHPDKALIGSVSVGGEAFIVAKFSYRKNVPGGCILRRPCFCHMGNARATALCPIHIFGQLSVGEWNPENRSSER